VAAFPAPAAETGLRDAIRENEAEAEAKEKALLDLTKQERELHSDLARTADRLGALSREVGAQEKRLAAIQKEEANVQERYADLVRSKKKAGAGLGLLLADLWPLYVQKNMVDRGRDIPTWDKADREFAWTSEIYRSVQVKLDQARRQQAAIQTTLARQQALASEVRTRLAAVNRSKDALLQDKLSFRRQLADVRREKTDREEELNSILTTIQSLNYRLRQEREQGGGIPMDEAKGRLPWPAMGRLVQNYAPQASPPRRGLGLALAENAEVLAVNRGKVVHDDVLRGFGRVIILMHDESWYSLYAFLAESKVELGQEVKTAQPIGMAGFYPEAQGPGLYFELRFHQKPINPELWLTAMK
jgi:septal ring factor EnvC (AmiA/AmiB activator)